MVPSEFWGDFGVFWSQLEAEIKTFPPLFGDDNLWGFCITRMEVGVLQGGLNSGHSDIYGAEEVVVGVRNNLQV